jgi:hypothetical protein
MAERFCEKAVEALRATGATGAAGDDREVGAVVVRVGDGADGALVAVERCGGGVRVSCSCGRRPCSHLPPVLDLFTAAASPPPRPLGAVSFSTPPPAPASGLRARPPDAEIAARLRRLLDVLVEDGVAVGSERTDAELEDLVRFLHGVDAYGLHRSLADLRREMATALPSPDRLLRAVEALEAACRVLERPAEGMATAPGVYELLVGRDAALGELEVREDLALLEVARNSARTPFGYRRDERFLVDLATGARYLELVPEPIDADLPVLPNRYAGSVGPFPRLIRADLAAIEAGPSPQRLRLMQYRVELGPQLEDLRRLAAAATREVPALYAEFAALSDALGVPWPCFAIFAPARVVFRDGEASLVDATDAVLPFARAVAPETCAAADRFLGRGKVELVVGHLLLLRRTLALSPLALLCDSPRGERIFRLR